MKRPYGLLWTGVAVAVAFWLFDSSVHRFAYGEPRFELVPSDFDELWMRVVICTLFILFGWYAAAANVRHQAIETEKEAQHRLAGALTLAIGEFLPICAHCKSVRVEDDQWVRIEKYIRDRTNTQLSHGICPSCVERHYH